MPTCPHCASEVDIRPAWNAFSYRGVFPAGQGVRCRQCGTVHKVSQRRLLAARVAPLLLLLPFLWIQDSPVWLRAVVGAAVLLVFFAPILRPIPGLYRLEAAEPFDDVRDDDAAFE